jgi:hypothetical protein
VKTSGAAVYAPISPIRGATAPYTSASVLSRASCSSESKLAYPDRVENRTATGFPGGTKESIRHRLHQGKSTSNAKTFFLFLLFSGER